MSKTTSSLRLIAGLVIIITALITPIVAHQWGHDLIGPLQISSVAKLLTETPVPVSADLPVESAVEDIPVEEAATNGRIYFASTRVNSRYKIFSIMEDGRGLTCLGMCAGSADPAGTGSTDPSTGRKPAVSPDGTKIAYVNDGIIYTMTSGGTGTQPLAIGDNPQWSPDGAHIIFHRNIASGFPSNFEIFVIKADGTGEFNMTNHPADDIEPSWGAASDSYPAGRIAWSSRREGTYDIMVNFPHEPISPLQNALQNAPIVNASNKHASRDSNPRWSHDGTKLAIASDRDDPSGEIYAVGIDSDFGTLSRVTNDPRSDDFPVWSPDGKRIAWARYMGNDGQNYEVWVVALADPIPVPNPYNLTQNTADDRWPTWGATTVAPQADVKITSIVDTPDPVGIDQRLFYQIGVFNSGPSTATGVKVITDPIPTGVDFSRSASPDYCDIDGNRIVTCTLPNALGTTGLDNSFRVDIAVIPRQAGTISFNARVTADQQDPNGSNNKPAQAVTTVVNPPGADLSLSVLYSQNIINNTVRVGDEYSVFFTVTNNGPANATTAVLIFTTAAGVQNVPSGTDPRCAATTNEEGQTLFVCSLGNLQNGASVTNLRIALKALAVGHRTDKASVTANEPDPTGKDCAATPSSNNCVTTGGQINGAPVDLELVGTYSQQIFKGENIELKVQVKNNGPGRATNVRLRIERGFSEHVALNVTTCVQNDKIYDCSMGTLDPGQTSDLVVLAVRPIGLDDHTLKIAATAAEPEVNPDPHPNNSTAVTKVKLKTVLKGLEVTQGVQDLANSVPLLKAKRTFVRAYLEGTALGFDEVTPELVVYRNTASGLVAERTLPISNPGRTYATVYSKANRKGFDSNPYFIIPGDLTMGDSYRFEIRLKGDPGPLICNEPDGVSDCATTVNFREAPYLPVELVMLTYRTGGVNYAPTSQQRELAIRQIESTFPIASLAWTESSVTLTPDACVSGSGPLGDVYQVILNVLNARRILDCPDLNCSRRYLGLLTPTPDNSCATGGVAWLGGFISVSGVNSLSSGIEITPAHEMGHSLGLKHVTYKAGPTGDAKDPGPHTPDNGTISLTKGDFDRDTIFGLDVYDFGQFDSGTPKKKDRVFGPDTPDFMSYAHARKWVSELHYRRLLSFLDGHGGVAGVETQEAIESVNVATEEIVLVSGTVAFQPGGASVLQPIYRVTSPRTVSMPVSGTHQIRFENSQGQSLQTYNFTPALTSDGTEAIASPFSFALPWKEGTTRISVLKNGEIIASQQASAATPQVNLVSPNGGQTLTGPVVNVQWEASDADPGSVLRYILQFSADGGTTWRTLATDVAATSYPLDLKNLTGTTNGRLRVIVTDGFNTSGDISDASFTVPPHKPSVSIAGIQNNTLFVANQVIVLDGDGYDVEDGLLPSGSLTWSSNKDGVLGTGRSIGIAANTLQEGTHTITLTGKDSDNETGTATVSVIIAREAPVLPPSLNVETSQLLFSAEYGSRASASQIVRIMNSGSGNITWTAQGDKPWIQLSSASGTTPSDLEVTLNPSGLDLGTTATGKITITAAGTAAGSPRSIDVFLGVVAGPPSNIDGRVLGPDGRAVRNAAVRLVDPTGQVRTVLTNSFGLFAFAGVQDGQYTIRISSKRYRFSQRVIQVFENATLANFVGIE